MKSKFTYIISLVIFLISTIYITWPLPFKLTELATSYGDELVISWIMNWNIHAILHTPLSLFSANTYYPYLFSLAYSDLHLTSSILALVPKLLLKEPITAFNFTLVSSIFLLGFLTFVLLYYQTKNFFSSIICGLLLVFSPALLDKKVHVQVLAIYWIPLAVLFFIQYLKNKNIKFLIISFTCFIFQTYNSFLAGYFLVFFYIFSFLFWTRARKTLIMKYINKQSVLVCFITLLLLIPIVIPYYVVSQVYDAKRDIRDAIHYGLQFEDLFYPNEHTRFAPVLNQVQEYFVTPISGEAKYGYIGGVFTLLTVVATILVFKEKYRKNKTYLIYMVTGWIGFILSMGPALHFFRQTVHIPFVIPLPYAALYYLAPGFMGFRNAARFEMMFILFMAFGIAHILPQWLRRFDKIKKAFIYGIIIVLIVVELPGPIMYIQAPQRKDFPPVYTWLTTTPKDTKIVELPIYNWYIQPFTVNEIFHQYYSTLHFRKMVNGASGYAPPEWIGLAKKLLHEFPSSETAKSLKTLDIDYIIIHTDEFDQMAKSEGKYDGRKIRTSKEILLQIKECNCLTLVKTFPNTIVFRLNKAITFQEQKNNSY